MGRSVVGESLGLPDPQQRRRIAHFGGGAGLAQHLAALDLGQPRAEFADRLRIAGQAALAPESLRPLVVAGEQQAVQTGQLTLPRERIDRLDRSERRQRAPGRRPRRRQVTLRRPGRAGTRRRALGRGRTRRGPRRHRAGGDRPRLGHHLRQGQRLGHPPAAGNPQLVDDEPDRRIGDPGERAENVRVLRIAQIGRAEEEHAAGATGRIAEGLPQFRPDGEDAQRGVDHQGREIVPVLERRRQAGRVAIARPRPDLLLAGHRRAPRRSRPGACVVVDEGDPATGTDHHVVGGQVAVAEPGPAERDQRRRPGIGHPLQVGEIAGAADAIGGGQQRRPHHPLHRHQRVGDGAELGAGERQPLGDVGDVGDQRAAGDAEGRQRRVGPQGAIAVAQHRVELIRPGERAAQGEDAAGGLAQLVDGGGATDDPPRLVGAGHRDRAAAEAVDGRDGATRAQHRGVELGEVWHKVNVPFHGTASPDGYRQLGADGTVGRTPRGSLAPIAAPAPL